MPKAAAQPIRPTPIALAVHQALRFIQREHARHTAMQKCCATCREEVERIAHKTRGLGWTAPTPAGS